MSSFLQAYTRVLRRWPEYFVILLLLITAMFTPVLQTMKFETDLDKFLPEDPVISASRRVDSYFGITPEPQYYLVTGPNVISARSLREELNITLQAGYVDGITGTLSLSGVLDEISKWVNTGGNWTRIQTRSIINLSDADVLGIRDFAFQVLDPAFNLSGAQLPIPPSVDISDLQLLIASLLPKDFRYGDTGARATVVVVNINGSLPSEKRKDVAVLVQARVEGLRLEDIRIQSTSTSLITREVDRATVEDNLPISLVIFIIIITLLALSFRGVSYVLLPIASMTMAGIWTFGAAVLLGIKLIAIDIAIVPLILGLGVDYFIHISSRYQEELRNDRRSGKAMSAALIGLFSSMSLAVLTTMAAFFTNIFTGIAPIRDFGLLCAVGVGSCALLSVTFYPAARIMIDRGKTDPTVKSLRDFPLFTKGLAIGAQTVRKYPVLVLISVMVVTAGSLVGAVNLRTEFGVEDFVQPDWPAMKAVSSIRDGFPAASMYQSYILIEGNVATPSALRSIYAIDAAASDDGYVVKTTIAGKVTPKIQSAAFVIRKAACYDTALCARFNLSSDGPLPNCTAADVSGLFDRLAGDPSYGPMFSQLVHKGRNGYNAAVVRVYNFVRDTSEGRKMYAELTADCGGRGIPTGGTILTIRTLDAFKDSQISSTVVSIVFAVVFLIIVYRNILLGLISVLPVLLSAVWVLGTMALLSISLNALTLTVTALTIGLGIDYTIYITQRYREERRGRKPFDAIQKTIENVGSAIFLCMLTTFAGFLVLGLSPMPLVQQFGIIAAATIAYSFILCVFVYPVFVVAQARMELHKNK